jgi:hypothetical protein
VGIADRAAASDKFARAARYAVYSARFGCYPAASRRRSPDRTAGVDA